MTSSKRAIIEALKLVGIAAAAFIATGVLAYSVAKADDLYCQRVSTLAVKSDGSMFSTFLIFPRAKQFRFCFLYYDVPSTACLSIDYDTEVRTENGDLIGHGVVQHEVTRAEIQACTQEGT